jgi:hypothetical protein
MKKPKEYRITEYLGYYTVEVLETKTKGYLWWKKKYTQWEICNILGGVFFISLLTSPPFLCETHEEAKEKMNEFILRDLTKN